MNENRVPEKPTYEFTEGQLAERKEILKKEIEHIKYSDLNEVSHLIDSFSKSSFQARNLDEVAKLFKNDLENETKIIWT